MKTRTVWISDVHLGSNHARSAELLNFLSRFKGDQIPEKLYIVGDFIDGWKVRRNWYWANEANLIIRRLLTLIKKGTQVYYIAGNHDEFMREFIDDFHLLDFGNIHLGNEFIHETIQGKRMLVVHGDMFDMVAQYAKWLCWLGDMGYEMLLGFNKIVNWIRKKLKMKHWSLSQAIKHNVKRAVNYVSDFEKCMTKYSLEKKCDGCICGHIHTAELLETNGFLYCNTGDWVESCTAILEDEEGNLTLYKHEMTT